MKWPIAILSAILLTGAVISGTLLQRDERVERKRIGGCDLDTLNLGLAFEHSDAPTSHAWLRIHSIDRVDDGVYRAAAAGLTTLLDSLGVRTYSGTDLVHVKAGSCWPRYTITMKVALESRDSSEKIRLRLLDSPLAGCAPGSERPEGYGRFFISCGRWAEDWWTVWYSVE